MRTPVNLVDAAARTQRAAPTPGQVGQAHERAVDGGLLVGEPVGLRVRDLDVDRDPCPARGLLVDRHSNTRSETSRETVTRRSPRSVRTAWGIGKSGYPTGYIVKAPSPAGSTVAQPTHHDG